MKTAQPQDIENQEAEKRSIDVLKSYKPRFENVEVSTLVRAHYDSAPALKTVLSQNDGRYRYSDWCSIPRFTVTHAATDSAIAALAESRNLKKNEENEEIGLVLRAPFARNGVISRFASKTPLQLFSLIELAPLELDIVDLLRLGSEGYSKSQALSAAIWYVFPEADGILYSSRMYPKHPCTAVYNRAIKKRGIILRDSMPVLDEHAVKEAIANRLFDVEKTTTT